MLTDKVGLIKNKMNSSLILILCDDGSLFLFFILFVEANGQQLDLPFD
jgi:hypothetical protein